jgi:hypothetical protein
MRKLLLASAAVLGASVGTMGFASAQTTNLPPAVLEGFPSAPQSVGGANNNNNYQAPLLPPGAVANPVPGSIVVRVNARVIFYGAVESSSLDKTPGVGPNNTGAAKLNPYTTLGYGRLYFGMDGMATNGLRYGGSIEVRVNVGPATGSSSNNQSSNSTFSDTLYVRRAFVYVATDKAGLFRGGQGDGPFGIFDNGITTFQGFDDGAWNGDLPGAIPGNSQPIFPFLTQQGAEYASSKFVYLSPQLAGFDIGLSYAPNNASLQDGATTGVNLAQPTSTVLGGCGTAAAGCYALSSSSNAADAARYTNAYVAAARYQGTFGPVGVLAYGGYMGSGHVDYTGGTAAATYNGLSLGQGGAAISVGPVQFGGAIIGGAVNGIGALQPKGGVHAVGWLGGIQYSSGPFTIGTSYFVYDSQGAPGLVGISQRHEVGYAAGMTYGIAPGLVLWVSYLYGTRHQGDYNFLTGEAGSAAYNNVKAQAGAIGTMVKL